MQALLQALLQEQQQLLQLQSAKALSPASLGSRLPRGRTPGTAASSLPRKSSSQASGRPHGVSLWPPRRRRRRRRPGGGHRPWRGGDELGGGAVNASAGADAAAAEARSPRDGGATAAAHSPAAGAVSPLRSVWSWRDADARPQDVSGADGAADAPVQLASYAACGPLRRQDRGGARGGIILPSLGRSVSRAAVALAASQARDA